MEPQLNASTFDKIVRWIKQSILLKLMSIGLLILILMIPVSRVQGLIGERQSRKYHAVREISSIWGNDQQITSPILCIPYRYFQEVYDEKAKGYRTIERKEFAYFLPEKISIDGTLNPEIRYRGIYEAIVYQSDIKLSGTFDKPNFELLDILSEDVLWDEATLQIGFTDLRSINNDVTIQWADQELSFDPGLRNDQVMSNGIRTSIAKLDQLSEGETIPFSMQLELKGSSSIHFIPVGKTTNVKLSSSWPDPSFVGAFLPKDKSISEEGFSAEWEVFHLNRPFPQQFIGGQTMESTSFGVNLLIPVDEYQQSTRAVKYAVLLISLTFLLFFLSQMMKSISIHPIQYLMVGFAICIFYTLLVALSEHIGFQKAYFTAGTVTLSTIVFYIQGIFKSYQLTAITGGLMGVTYGFIFIVIRQQDYALLMGSIGLFIVMALLMVLTRHIEWSKIGRRSSELQVD